MGKRTKPVVRRTQTERSAATRSAIMTATIELLVEHGHANITMEDIASRANVTRGAVHHHFETREDLWAATQRELMARMDEDLNFQHAARLDVNERINIVLDGYWSVFGGPLFLASLEIRAFGRLNLELRKRIQDEFEITAINRDRIWVEVFKDLGASPEELRMARILMLDLLRGFALRRITQGMNSVSAEEIGAAKRMIGALLLK